MATKQEAETIAKIRETIRMAKTENKQPAAELSNGVEKYHRALTFVRESGFFIMVLVPISYTLAMISFLGTISPYISISDTILGEVLIRVSLYTLFALVAIVLGYKIRSLTMTPRAMLASLIGLLILELILFLNIGILGLLLLILTWTTTICGMVKWSMYKEWFYRFGDDDLEEEEEEEREDEDEYDDSDTDEEEYDEYDEYLDGDPYI